MFAKTTIIMMMAVVGLPYAYSQQPHSVTTQPSGSTPSSTPAPISANPASIAVAHVVDDDDVDLVPRTGFNAALVYNSTHDSAANWSDSTTPYVSYAFNKHFSSELSCPVYILRYAENTTVVPKAGQTIKPQALRGEAGDTLLANHAAFSNHYFDYLVTLSATLPSGDTVYGLSTGRVTFDLTHDFSHKFGIFGPGAELGAGDSNTFSNSKTVADFISLGPIAHFQLGSTVDLPLRMLFEADAYEDLPIGDQKIYTTVVLKKQTTTEVIGTHVSEDNGFTTQLDIPLNDQIVLSGFYSRSRRFGIDTAGVSMTFLLRNPLMLSRDSAVRKQLDALTK